MTTPASLKPRQTNSPCGSCGATPTYTIRLAGRPMPACLRHLNHWRTPSPDYTCPTACVEKNHPCREHSSWLADYEESRMTTPTPATPEPTEPSAVRCGWMADRLPHTAHGSCDGFLPHLAEGLQRLMVRQAPTEDQR